MFEISKSIIPSASETETNKNKQIYLKLTQIKVYFKRHR